MNLLLRLQAQGQEPRTPPTAQPRERATRRAVMHWCSVLDKISDLLMLASLQERMGDWFSASWPHCLQAGCVKPLADGMPPEPSRKTASKQADYKWWIRTAQKVAPRKMKGQPFKKAEVCDHPAHSLRGGGNGAARDIWCYECHTRWDANGFEGALIQKLNKEAEQARAIEGIGMETDASASGGPLKCPCGVEAVRLTVKKSGLTQGRHFYKCARRICDFFEWDPEEIKALKDKELERAGQAQLMEDFAGRLNQEITIVQKQAEQNMQEQMRVQQETHQQEMLTMKAQFESALHQLQQHAVNAYPQTQGYGPGWGH